MPVLLGMLVNMLRIMLMARLGMMVAKVLAFFGLTWASNKYAVDPAMDFIRDLMQQGPSGSLGAQLMGWAGVLRLDTAISMLLSAYAAAWTIKSAKAFLMKTE